MGREQAWPIIIKGLKRLEYRGYDSAGIVVLGPSGQFQFRKTVGKVNGLEPFKEGDFPQGTLGLGHTRWATHGRPSDANAHPHTDCHQRVAVVHNGIVENFLPLREELKARQHRFSSDTDTEVIAHLLEEGLDQRLSFEDAFRRLGHLLKGSQAVTAIMQGARVQDMCSSPGTCGGHCGSQSGGSRYCLQRSAGTSAIT